MSGQTSEPVRQFRNITTILFLIFLALASCFYLTGALVLVTINSDWNIIKNLLGNAT